MANLYLTEQGSVVRKTGDRLVVEKDRTKMLEVECFKLDTVFLFGNVHVTTPALTKLLEHGIELALLTRDGRLKGQLTPPKTKNVPLRMAQYRHHHDPRIALPLARTFVRGKIANALALLTRQHRNYPQRGFDGYRRELRRVLDKVETDASLESLRGLEGQAARTYFTGVGLACRTDLTFEGRRRRAFTFCAGTAVPRWRSSVRGPSTKIKTCTSYDPYADLGGGENRGWLAICTNHAETPGNRRQEAG